MNYSNVQLDFSPAFFLLFALPAFAFLFWRLILWREDIVKVFASSPIAASLLVVTSKQYSMRRAIYLLLAWLFAVIAFSQPKGGARYPEEGIIEAGKSSHGNAKRKSHDLVFAVDTSQSMAIRDSDQAKTRLDKAKELADELAGTIRGDTVNLYSVTSDATRLVPPTIDYLFLRLILAHMTYNEGEIAGTDLVVSLQTITAQLKQEPFEKSHILLLFTDGGDTEWETSIGTQKNARQKQILAAVQEIVNLKTKIFIIGTGSKQGDVVPDVLYQGKEVRSNLQSELLKTMANEGLGFYWEANAIATTQLVNEIASKIKEQSISLQDLSINQTNGSLRELIYDYYFQVPLFLALLFLAIAVCIPLKTVSLAKE